MLFGAEAHIELQPTTDPDYRPPTPTTDYRPRLRTTDRDYRPPTTDYRLTIAIPHGRFPAAIFFTSFVARSIADTSFDGPLAV
jgi:hypothetical protein